MSESSAIDETHADAPEHGGAQVPEPPFNDDELEQFADDDRKAGGTIGKLLAFFFLYTIFAMSIAAYWTYQSLAD